MTGIRTLALASVAAAAVLVSAQQVAAQSFTIQGGQTVGATQTMAGNGDTGIVEPGGTISTSGDNAYGISSTGANAAIANSGTITTTGGDAVGIRSTGANAKISNSGTITTSGDYAYGILSTAADAAISNSETIRTSGAVADGIRSTGANAAISNSGTISTSGDSAVGISSQGANAAISNSGTITTSGINAYGIWSQGADAAITNSGTITTSGTSAVGILSTGANAAITNNGTITTTGGGAVGIRSQGANAAISNSGTITTTGGGAMGILSAGANAAISNSGTITTSGATAYGILSNGANAAITNAGAVFATGPGSYAIAVGGANSSLTLQRGSLLQGDLWFAAAYAATTRLTLAPGWSTALRFDMVGPPGFPGGLPATITAGGMPLAVNAASGLVATADVSALRGQGQMLGDLTGGIFAAVDGRRGTGAAVAAIPYAAETNAAARAAFAADFRKDEARYERTTWLKGFGGSRTENGSGVTLEQDQALAGAVSGVDLFASASGKAGLFAGGAFGRTDVPQSQQIAATSAFGGAYGTFWFGSATLDLALTLGWTRYDSSRRVADNTAAGGIAFATADYDGAFVAPRIALTQPFLIGPQVFEAKLSGYYAGLFLNGFTETGSIAPLSVDKRDLHLFVGRAGLSMPLEQAWGYGVTRVIPTIGLEGRVQTGDNLVNGTLVGTGIVFDAGNRDILGGFAALRIEHDMNARLALFAETEGLLEDTGSARFLAAGGMKLRF